MKNLVIAICGILSLTQLAAQDDVNVMIIGRTTGVKGLPNLDTIRVFGFAEGLMDWPELPGPTITANEGDSVHIDFWNVSQGAPHTIHLHGLDVNQQNDGVPHLSFSVHHMDHGYYHFKAPHAGTYLYHCHVASTIHVQAGMYGSIIIRPSDGSNTTWNGGIPYDNEYSYFQSEIDTVWHNDTILDHEHDTSTIVHEVSIPEYHPQWFLVNGRADNQIIEDSTEFSAAVGEVNYVRLTNIGYYGNRIIFPPSLQSRIVSSDGRPLPTEEVSDTVYLFPGERYGVINEALTEMVDSIQFDYIDMNTMEIKNTQYIPVSIEGFATIKETGTLKSISIYPNPTSGQQIIDIESSDNENVDIEVLDIMGKVLLPKQRERIHEGLNSIQLNISKLSAGNYIVRIVGDKGSIRTSKIIKKP